MSLNIYYPLVAILAAGASPASAGIGPAAAAKPLDGVELAEASQLIVVEGKRPEYGAKSTSTATKTRTEIKDVPQALSVVSEQQIEDQQLRSVSELLYFVPGATPSPGEGHRDQIVLRGNNSTADFFVDGIRDDAQYFRDLYNVDRVEVLKGPNAMIFGRGGGGGVVNRVLKRSSLSAYREVLGSVDAFGGVRFTGDFDQPLGAGVGARLNAMYENGDSFRRYVDLNRYGLNPTVALLAGPDTRIDLSYEYLRDRRTVDRGVPAFNDEPLRGFDRTFFGDPERSFSRADVNLGTLSVGHELGAGLTLRNRTILAAYDKYYQNVYPTGLDETTDVVSLGAYSLRSDRANLLNQTELVWESRWGGIDQTLLFGLEFGRQKSRNERRAAAGSTATLAEPTVERPLVFVSTPTDNRTRAGIAAFYMQDQIRLSPMFEIIAGVRFERFRLSVDDLRPAGLDLARTDQMVSPRLGLVAKPRRNLSVYASYSRSYLPQSGDQFATLDLTSKALKPERFDNYEIGAKWEPVPGLLATAAIYQLDRTNTSAPNPDGSGTVVLTGAQRSRGLELGLERSISHRWQVSAGYALQKAEITETTSAAPAGREVPLVPRHAFSLWNRYDVSDKFGLGFGAIARSKSYASVSNKVILPGYARFDAAAYYEIRRGIELQLNVENLLGARYFPTAYNDNNIAPGAPRTAKATLRINL